MRHQLSRLKPASKAITTNNDRPVPIEKCIAAIASNCTTMATRDIQTRKLSI